MRGRCCSQLGCCWVPPGVHLRGWSGIAGRYAPLRRLRCHGAGAAKQPALNARLHAPLPLGVAAASAGPLPCARSQNVGVVASTSGRRRVLPARARANAAQRASWQHERWRCGGACVGASRLKSGRVYQRYLPRCCCSWPNQLSVGRISEVGPKMGAQGSDLDRMSSRCGAGRGGRFSTFQAEPARKMDAQG